MSSDAQKPKLVTIAGPHLRDHTPQGSFVLSFGKNCDLSELHLKTIQVLRHFGAKPVMKKNNVRLILSRVTELQYDRIVFILNQERIPYVETEGDIIPKA